jgi:hypothetical protein
MALRTPEQRNEVYRRRLGRLRRRRAGHTLVTAFILWHLFALLIWNMPAQSNLAGRSMTVVRPYMTGTGLMQGWVMFAPDPYRLDVSVEARVAYSDGAVRSWYFPRMAKLSYAARYNKERWRKYVEVMHQDAWSILWPPAARYAARVNDDRPGARPVSVELVRHWRIIPDPGRPLPPISAYSFFKTPVRPEDLR